MTELKKLEDIDPWGYYGSQFDEITETDEGALRSLLVGHTVAKVGDDILQLDDGRRMRLMGNTGGCICSAGDYALTALNDMPDNAITNVRIVRREHEDNDSTYEPDEVYEIFVIATDERLLARFDGSDGNGYYGTGFQIYIEKERHA